MSGLWFGVGAGCILQAFFYIRLCLYVADWNQIADEAYKRVQEEGKTSFENSNCSIEKKLLVSTDKEKDEEEPQFIGSFNESESLLK